MSDDEKALDRATLEWVIGELEDEALRPRNPPPAVEALEGMARFFRAEADEIGVRVETT